MQAAPKRLKILAIGAGPTFAGTRRRGVMATNGDVNREFGIYKSVCCGAEIVINPGAAFPDCPNHRKLSTIWKPYLEEKSISQTANKPELDPILEAHIENRQLFKIASGQLKLEAWEQAHIHGCKVCQGVLHFFVKQPISAPTENPPKSSDAA
jgi:hypothetical protein